MLSSSSGLCKFSVVPNHEINYGKRLSAALFTTIVTMYVSKLHYNYILAKSSSQHQVQFIRNVLDYKNTAVHDNNMSTRLLSSVTYLTSNLKTGEALNKPWKVWEETTFPYTSMKSQHFATCSRTSINWSTCETPELIE